MTDSFDYNTFTTRNKGYISPRTQTSIADTTLLIAGCGMGSAPAVCAARTGFRKFILVDGDVVDAHNLNRQFYGHSDIGLSKVECLKKHILDINPEAEVEAIQANLDATNTADIVSRCDIVFDTVDTVDLPAVIGLHNEAAKQGKPLFTAINVGFGALVWYLPPDAEVNWPSLLADDARKVREAGGNPDVYHEVYISFIGRLADSLDREVLDVVDSILEKMKEGKPCPAPQLAVGSFSAAALAMTMIHDLLAGYPVVSSPSLVVQSYRAMETKIVTIK
ncbi:ThiF family adenylyltransferase [Pararhizobium sp. BT-229]|uniref:ThiF family adenylyltransferase n=1 Tax=Pararhizobium sp. BT-229 TaxID=2986923 RepID=UPI0021F7FC85|nr:ThiF family adenylyltransferase [Pararhizobium sp. BT-229]MCV9963653.1 ThiF family adenylyltransferase [Pararhizobium sp. BT-229]